MAERSKALESGASDISSPKGRGFESHFRQMACFRDSFLINQPYLHKNIEDSDFLV